MQMKRGRCILMNELEVHVCNSGREQLMRSRWLFALFSFLDAVVTNAKLPIVTHVDPRTIASFHQLQEYADICQ